MENKIKILTEREDQILRGGLLGDGSLGIYKNYVNARHQFRHSAKQSEWFSWKSDELKRLASSKAVHRQGPDGYSKVTPKLHFETLTHPALTGLYYQITTEGRKDVTKPWVDELKPLGLLVWWCDDGGLTGRDNSQGRLSTQGFSKTASQRLQGMLFNNFGLKTTLHKLKKNPEGYYYCISIQRAALKRLLLLILPHLECESMLYKFKLKFKEPIGQQHWISSLKEVARPELHGAIDRMYLG
jgi:LAGLIDADG DNA endonuclease family